jgi:hypothetical protein
LTWEPSLSRGFPLYWNQPALLSQLRLSILGRRLTAGRAWLPIEQQSANWRTKLPSNADHLDIQTYVLYSKPMRTTVRLNDALLQQARKEATRRGVTLTSLLEEGLRLALLKPAPKKRPRIELPVSTKTGGLLPGVDLSNSAALLDLMDGI